MKEIMLSQVRYGERFVLDDVAWIKLGDIDSGATLVLTEDVIKELGTIAFNASEKDRRDANNYVGSTLERTVHGWLAESHPKILAAALPRPIDLLTMDGMTDYGTPSVVARALTVDEYRKYRLHIPLASDYWWLATGWSTLRSPYSNDYYAYYVNTSGALSNINVNYANYNCPRPALALTSEILVSVDVADEKTLASYSELELLAELQRRVNHD